MIQPIWHSGSTLIHTQSMRGRAASGQSWLADIDGVCSNSGLRCRDPNQREQIEDTMPEASQAVERRHFRWRFRYQFEDPSVRVFSCKETSFVATLPYRSLHIEVTGGCRRSAAGLLFLSDRRFPALIALG